METSAKSNHQINDIFMAVGELCDSSRWEQRQVNHRPQTSASML